MWEEKESAVWYRVGLYETKKNPAFRRFSHGKPETRCFCAAVSVHRGKQRCGDIYRFAHFFHHHIVPTFIPLATTRPPRELGLTLSFNVMATEFQKKCPQMQLFFSNQGAYLFLAAFSDTFYWVILICTTTGTFYCRTIIEMTQENKELLRKAAHKNPGGGSNQLEKMTN